MPKTKNQPTNSGKQKLLNAQHRNAFLMKIRKSCKTIVGEDVFQLLPPSEFNKIFHYRAKPIVVETEEGQTLPSKITKSIQELINYYIKSQEITIVETQRTIKIIDFYTSGLTLDSYFKKMKEGDFKQVARVRSLIQNSGLEMKKIVALIFDKIYEDLFPFLLNFLNAYWLRFYSFRLDVSLSKDMNGLQFVIVVKQYQHEKKRFSIDGIVRPAFRIGWTFKTNVFEWLFICPPQLGIQSLPKDQKLPVYIQSHAIQRIFERVDCIHADTLISCIYHSLRDCVAIGDRGKFIFEYRIANVKVGYLSGVLVDGKLVIRTFLFLTFNGTPEGKRLENFIGLKSLDTKYLKMDKLSSFMTAKLSKDDDLRAIFKKADCLHLVELYDKLDRFSVVHPDHSPIEMLTRYLETERN